MEKNYNVSFNFFDQALVERVVSFQESGNTDKESKEALKQEIKNIYLEKDSELKELIKNELVTLKEEHLNIVKQLEEDLVKDLAEAAKTYEGQLKTKQYKEVKFGIEIACKRAKIKERNRYNEVTKELKLKRFFLHEEYTRLIYNVTGVVTPIESVRSKFIETKAVFNLKATLTNKKTWINLVPLFMLILVIAAYAIGKNITGYNGDLGDVINNSIFVAVVATGAVFIYSQGGFDMSLGNASLMCATIAALMYNSTGNLFLSLLDRKSVV